MEEFDESINNQIAALLRVIGLTQNFRDDAVPSKIEEVGIYLFPFSLLGTCFTYLYLAGSLFGIHWSC